MTADCTRHSDSTAQGSTKPLHWLDDAGARTVQAAPGSLSQGQGAAVACWQIALPAAQSGRKKS